MSILWGIWTVLGMLMTGLALLGLGAFAWGWWRADDPLDKE